MLTAGLCWKFSRILRRSDWWVPPKMNTFPSLRAYFSSAYTSSEKTMILSPRDSW